MLCFGVLGEWALGVFLYLNTTLWTSGVLDVTDTLMVVLTRGGDETGMESAATTCRGPVFCRAGSICHRSIGAAGGCFKRIRSLSWASADIAISIRLQSAEVAEFELAPVLFTVT